jgi:hypothetical protein
MIIERAFAEVPPPADDNLYTAVGDEVYEDTEPFRGKQWQELAPDFLQRHYNALFWFSPEAFHYYLPAFLKGGLVTPDADYVVTILNFLEPTARETLAGFRAQRWARLSVAQITALEVWLRWILENAKPGPVFEAELKRSLQVVRDRYWW